MLKSTAKLVLFTLICALFLSVPAAAAPLKLSSQHGVSNAPAQKQDALGLSFTSIAFANTTSHPVLVHVFGYGSDYGCQKDVAWCEPNGGARSTNTDYYTMQPGEIIVWENCKASFRKSYCLDYSLILDPNTPSQYIITSNIRFSDTGGNQGTVAASPVQPSLTPAGNLISVSQTTGVGITYDPDYSKVLADQIASWLRIQKAGKWYDETIKILSNYLGSFAKMPMYNSYEHFSLNIVEQESNSLQPLFYQSGLHKTNPLSASNHGIKELRLR